MAFSGFPVAALDYYDDLEVDNTRSFFEAHRDVYERAVRAPMTALCEELADEFGPATIFRPHRDVRFAADKTPYKTHQGAFVAAGPATGWYVQVAAPGVRVGAGFYRADPAELSAIRVGIDDDREGAVLRRRLNRLTRDGFEISGDRLRTSPRGYAADHPRIDLLRHRSLTVGRHYGFEPFVHTRALLERVREDWRSLRPLVAWVAARRAAPER